MTREKKIKYINIISFILWLCALIKVTTTTDINDLRFACIASMIVVLVDIGTDIKKNIDNIKNEQNKRNRIINDCKELCVSMINDCNEMLEICENMMNKINDNDKQGDK